MGGFARLRARPDRMGFLRPGRPGAVSLAVQASAATAVKVQAFPTSNLFKRGHRIRLDVSSSNFPHFDVNPNTGAAEGTGLVRQVARNTVFLAAAHPSHVLLPVIPRRLRA